MAAKLTWCGHSTFRLDLPDERVVFIDPWLTGNPACPDQLKKPERCDFIFLTHGHFDHVGDVAPLIEKFDPLIVGNYDLCSALEKTIGKGRFSGMNTGGTQPVEGINVTLTSALHSSGLDSPNGPIYAGMPNGLIVEVQGLAKIYHAGDTDVFSDMQLIRKLWAPQICILPIGDYFTMGSAGAALAAEFLQPKTIIPCHYQTFPLLAQTADSFRNALPGELRDRLVAPEVGQALAWSSDGATPA